jgi:hypothetical protein
MDGTGLTEYVSGDRYEGEFVAGSSTRGGTLTLAGGRQFKTDLVTGIDRPANFLAPAVLLVMCFDTGGVLNSVDVVRSSGFSLEDDKAIGIVKVRDADRGIVKLGAAGGEQLIADPVPGCHMVGVSFGQGGYVIFHNS